MAEETPALKDQRAGMADLKTGSLESPGREKTLQETVLEGKEGDKGEGVEAEGAVVVECWDREEENKRGDEDWAEVIK